MCRLFHPQSYSFFRVDWKWQRATIARRQLPVSVDDPLPACLMPVTPIGAPQMVVDIRSDGNCFFRAISFMLTGSQIHHNLIRRELTNFMSEEVRKEVNNFAATDEDYFHNWKMPSDGVWATEVELLSAAAFLDIDIYTFTRPRPMFNERLRKMQQGPWAWTRHGKHVFSYMKNEVKGKPPSPKKTRAIYLYHQNRNHYLPVLSTY